MSNKATFSCIVFIFALAALTIDGCKPKNSDVLPHGALSDSLVSSPCILLAERINDVLYRAYEYDTSRNLLRMTEYSGSAANNRITKRYRFDYEKQHLVRFTETNLVARDQSLIYEFDYDSDGILRTIRPFRVFNSGPRVTDTLTVKYDDNRYINELSSARTGAQKWQYDSLGNIKQWLIRTPAATQDSILAEYGAYDNKINLYGFSKTIQLVRLLVGNAASRRNPLIYTLKGQSISASYQYNDRNVPTQSVVKTTSAGDNTLRETVFSYELGCQ